MYEYIRYIHGVYRDGWTDGFVYKTKQQKKRNTTTTRPENYNNNGIKGFLFLVCAFVLLQCGGAARRAARRRREKKTVIVHVHSSIYVVYKGLSLHDETAMRQCRNGSSFYDYFSIV